MPAMNKVIDVENGPFGKYWIVLTCGCIYTFDKKVSPEAPTRWDCSGKCNSPKPSSKEPKQRIKPKAKPDPAADCGDKDDGRADSSTEDTEATEFKPPDEEFDPNSSSQSQDDDPDDEPEGY